jgi:hypothetical protein
MPRLLRHRRLALWVTLVTLVLATLAPGVARALAFASGDAAPWTVVCSAANGLRAADGAPAALSVHGVFDSCPFCLAGLDTHALPPVPLSLALPLRLADVKPRAFWHAPRPLFAWRAAQARAPPTLS